MRAGPLTLVTLTDRGQSADVIAHTLADWLQQAERTLDIALYNVRVPGPPGDRLAAALRDAAARGVVVRAMVHHPDLRPEPLQAAPVPRTRLQLLQRFGIQVRTVARTRELMHHKFAVRDGEAVWTGSANWAVEDWTREENLLIAALSPPLAAAYERVFAELWESGDLSGTGDFEPVWTQLGAARGRVWFCPGRGRALSQRIAERIEQAERRVRVASPLVTAGVILHALDAPGTRDVAGIVDRVQTERALAQWRAFDGGHWKAPVLERILGAGFAAKPSTTHLGSPDVTPDIMHAKLVVADDAIFAGSFNLSRSGEDNAENMLEIEDAALADRMARWIDELRERYPPARPVLSSRP